MRFSLQLVKTQDSERVLINLMSRQPRSFGKIIGILDTGSPKTIISAMDAHLLKIPISSLETVNAISGFGRGSLPCKILNNFKIAIKSEDDKIKIFEIPIQVVDISALKKMNQDYRNHAFQIPSVIGLDFLKLLNLSLNLNFNEGIAYLEENNPA
jgi:hypothetical protein